MIQQLELSFLALILSYLGVAGLRRWTEHRQILDSPNERSSHTCPTPRGGGLAIVIVSLVGISVAWFSYPIWSVSVILCYLISATGIAVVGWLDDVYRLPNRLRFVVHSSAAVVIIWGCNYWVEINLPFIGDLYLGWLGLPITWMWIVGLTNAYNFMDGIDGIAGGQAVAAGLGWAVLGGLTGQPLIGSLGFLLAASSVGFLGLNWPPARIFMGDVGSTFLGFTLAVLPLIAAQSDSRLVLAGALLVWPFVFDTTYTFVRRMLKKENVFTAHRSHLYQRLIIAGWSHRFVTLLYIVLGLFGFILALTWFKYPGVSSSIIISGIFLLCLLLWLVVSRQERGTAISSDPPRQPRSTLL